MSPMSLERRTPFPGGRLFAFRQGINLNESWGPFAEPKPTATPRAKGFRRKASLVYPYLIMVITILRGGLAFAELVNRAIAVRPLGEAFLAELDGGDITPNLGGYDPCEVEEPAAFDMVEWIVQSYPGHENTYLRDEGATSTVSDFSLHDPTRRRFFRISGTSGFGNEVFEYDENFVYIRRETMHSSPRDFYYHYAGYVWCPRVAFVVARTGRACNPVITNNAYYRYLNCVLSSSGGTPFQVSVQGPFLLSLGGNLGEVVALRVRSVNLTNGDSEYYYYARPYGMVYFEKFVGGRLARFEVFNTFFSPEIPLVIECDLGY